MEDLIKNIDSIISRSPSVDHEVYRGFAIYSEQFNRMEVGGYVTNRSYLSTSVLKDKAKNFISFDSGSERKTEAVIAEFIGIKECSASVQKYTGYKFFDENEVLIKRGQVFELLEKEKE